MASFIRDSLAGTDGQAFIIGNGGKMSRRKGFADACNRLKKVGPRHNSNAPGLAEGESAAVLRMLIRDQKAAAER